MTRILHLTDLHLRHHQPGSADPPIRRSREMPEMLGRLMARVPELDVDVIVITGDLLDVPDEVIAGESPDGRDLPIWLAEVEQDFRLMRESLAATGVDYVVCPGNHDHEGLFSRVFPEATAFVDAAGLRFVCFWDELGPDRQPRRTAARRDLFEQALNAPEHNVSQIHIQHYTVYPPITSNGARYDYLGAAALKESLESSGRVRAVLSGHYHPGVLAEEGGVFYSGPPAFCEAPYPFRIYNMRDDGSFQSEDHCCDVPD